MRLMFGGVCALAGLGRLAKPFSGRKFIVLPEIWQLCAQPSIKARAGARCRKVNAASRERFPVRVLRKAGLVALF